MILYIQQQIGQILTHGLTLVPIVIAFGCTDSLAMNYDPNIVIDDNSCTYQMTYVLDDNFEQNMESQGWGNGHN